MNKQLIDRYAHSDSILAVLDEAVRQEKEFLNGMDFGAGIKLRAYINSQGLWEIVLTSPLGLLVFSVLDEAMNEAHIQSFPNIDSTKNAIGLNNQDKLKLAKAASSEAYINIRDIKSLRNIKTIFKNDYILSNIIVDPTTQTEASEFVIASIRNYRRAFKMYEKRYAFLWKNTGLHGAIKLQNLIYNF